MHIKVREFITNGATKVCVISVHVKLYLCVAGTRVRARPCVGRWWVKMPGPFFNPSPSLTHSENYYFSRGKSVQCPLVWNLWWKCLTIE